MEPLSETIIIEAKAESKEKFTLKTTISFLLVHGPDMKTLPPPPWGFLKTVIFGSGVSRNKLRGCSDF